MKRCRSVGRAGNVLNVRGISFIIVRIEREKRPPLFFLAPINRLIHRDAQHPRAERALKAKAANGAKCPQKCFLIDILRIRQRAGHAERHIQDLPVVQDNQFLKRFVITVLRALNEFELYVF